MQLRTFVLSCCLLAGAVVVSRGEDASSLSGYVTRAVSGSDFDVNGKHILCDKKTRTVLESAHGSKASVVGCPTDAPFVGQALIVFGPVYNGSSSIHVRRIQSLPSEHPEATGSAVIDTVPDQNAANASGLIVRADGYRISISPETKVVLRPPLKTLSDVKAGNWIGYKGKTDATGMFTAASVEIGPNVIDTREEKLRAGKEYDPSAVPANARQNYLKMVISGYDPKKFPPYQDAAMQARVEKIGSSLVPAYQDALPDSDPAKIHFRFQVIDNKDFCVWTACDAITLPNGIVLVPRRVVERMQNDSQLAAVLANSIARALEKQQLRTAGKLWAAYASTMAASFVPYAGLGLSLGGTIAEGKILATAMEQSSRVSLALLRDAGYDIDQAPLAWWLLASEKPEPISTIDIPDHAVYLYRVLGEIWNNPAASASKVQ